MFSPDTFGTFLYWIFRQCKVPVDIWPLLASYTFDPPHPACKDLLVRSHSFKGLPVLSLSTGFSHAAFILGDGRLFTFGANSFGQCGFPPSDGERSWVDSPRLVGERIVQVACGNIFTVCVCSSTGSVSFAGGYKWHPVYQTYSPLVAAMTHFKKLPYHPPVRLRTGRCSGVIIFDYGYAVVQVFILSQRRTRSIVHGQIKGDNVLAWRDHVWLLGTKSARLLSIPVQPRCSACFATDELRRYNDCCLLHRDCAALCYILSSVCPCGAALDTSRYTHIALTREIKYINKDVRR